MSRPWNDPKTLRTQFSFICDKSEADLEKTATDDVLFCGQCQKEVHRVQSKAEWDIKARNGTCVLAKTQSNETWIAKPVNPQGLYLRLDAEHGGNVFGPYVFREKNQEVLIGSALHMVTVHIPAILGAEPNHLSLMLRNGRIFYFPGDDGARTLIIRKGEQAEETATRRHTELFDGDRIIIGNSAGPGFKLSIEPITLEEYQGETTVGYIAPNPSRLGKPTFGERVQQGWSRLKKWWRSSP